MGGLTLIFFRKIEGKPFNNKYELISDFGYAWLKKVMDL